METPVYAVVDLEMTSSNLKKGKLIQFGCVFVQNEQIIGSYSTDINPEELISPEIEALTGITNERIVKAPYFVEVASEIKEYLKNCVFVAHNVNFDFKFLNRQFEIIGLEPLTCPAIDTVELTQIFYPTLDSYKLTDLANYFQLYHDKPHQADSDAYVTAELFIKITNKIRSLPKETVAKIIQRGNLLSLQTRQYIKKIYQQIEKTATDDFIYLARIPIKKRSVEQETFYTLAKQLIYREKQQEMQAIIAKDLKIAKHNFLIEAPTGSGKTLAYLAAFQDRISKYQPLIISTSSIVLQEQVQKELKKLNQTREYKLKATILKSFNHYLDLKAFINSLSNQEAGATERLWQMKILVWLTETTTGDLDEIHARKELAYIQKIQHHGIKTLNKRSKFYQYDFVKQLIEQVKQSEILIVNHAYLLAEQYRTEQVLPKTKYLIIDEAHKFSELFEQTADIKLNIADFRRKLRQLRQELQNFSKQEYVLLEQTLNQYSEALSAYTLELKVRYQNGEDVFTVVPSFKEMSHNENNLRELLKYLTNEAVLQIQKNLQEKKLNLYIEQLLQELQRFIDLFYLFLTAKQPAVYKELKFYYDQIYYELLDGYHQKLTKQKWFNNFEKCFFIGSTLLVDNKADFFKQILQLNDLEVDKIADDWHYHGKVYVLTDQKENEKWYNERQVANLLLKLVKKEKTNKILCLLTSHKQLQRIYQSLRDRLQDTSIQVLAQDQTGSKTRNLKQFEKAKAAILLGTDTMWEGIDLAGDALNTVIISKLPFQAPFTSFKQYQANYLKEQGKQPFYDDALPRAMMKLRQGFGRLYRSEEDQGNLIILDKRFITSSYAMTLKTALPEQIKVIETDQKACLQDLK